MVIEFLVPYDRPSKNLVMLSPDFGLTKIAHDLMRQPVKMGDNIVGFITDVIDVSYYYDDYKHVKVTAEITSLNNEILSIANSEECKVSFEYADTYWQEIGNSIECTRCHHKMTHHGGEPFPKHCPKCGVKIKQMGED